MEELHAMSHGQIHVIPQGWQEETDLEKLNEYVSWLEPPTIWSEPASSAEQAKKRITYILLPTDEVPP